MDIQSRNNFVTVLLSTFKHCFQDVLKGHLYLAVLLATVLLTHPQ